MNERQELANKVLPYRLVRIEVGVSTMKSYFSGFLAHVLLACLHSLVEFLCLVLVGE